MHKSANAFDVDGVLKLFTPDAVIDAPSTGHRFDGHAGVRKYIADYLIGYHTMTKLLSVMPLERRGQVKVSAVL